MSQRLIEERQRRILGITGTGRIIPIISGAEDDPDKKDDSDKDSSGAGGDNDTQNDGGAAAGTGARVYSETEYAALQNRMAGADRAKSEAEKKVKEYEDKSRTELEKAKNDLAETTARAAKAEAELLQAKINNKFLSSNKHSWHDAETALKLLDLSEVEVKEDGSVEGLDAAIDALAKAKPFLINGEGAKDKKDDKKDTKDKDGRPSGKQPPANGGDDRSTDRARLLEKYPQLAR